MLQCCISSCKIIGFLVLDRKSLKVYNRCKHGDQLDPKTYMSLPKQAPHKI